MTSKWELKPLGELCLLINRGVVPAYVEQGGILVINQKCIRNHHVSLAEAKRTDPKAKRVPEDRLLRPFDVLVNSTGVGTLGRVAQVKKLSEPATVDSHVTIIRPDPRKIYPHYLGFALEFKQPEIEALAEGSTGQIELPRARLRGLEIPVPPFPSQRAIAHILGTLDDKIELLRRMNETLEAMARALFKSWFVDFDPVIDNALEAGNPIPNELKEKAKRRLALGERRKPLPEHIRRLFPDRFVDSELGPIPDGWRVGTVAELVSLSRESINPRDFPDEVFDHYSIPAFDAGKMPISEPGCAIKSNKLLVPRDAVLLSKLNPRFPRVWMPAVSWSRRSICSTEFLVALPKSGSSRDFIFCLFTEAGFLARFSSLVTGTSGSHQRVKPDSFLTMQIIIPPNDVVGSFTCLVRLSFEQLFRNLAQSRTLAALRDALLPKLISGEIRVENVKRFLEKGES